MVIYHLLKPHSSLREEEKITAATIRLRCNKLATEMKIGNSLAASIVLAAMMPRCLQLKRTPGVSLES